MLCSLHGIVRAAGAPPGKTEESFKREASVDGDYELCFLNDATDAMLKLNNEPVGEEIK